MLQRETPVDGSLRGGFLCDEMGLGKTIQLIATMLGNPKNKTLIVVPKTIVSQWRDELRRFAPYFRVGLFDGPKRVFNPDAVDVVIAPYSIFIKPEEGTELHSISWDRIILDEGHEIRSLRSKRHISLAFLRTDIRWIVSGTPVYNSMKDFVNLCLFLGLTKNFVQCKTEEVRTRYVLRRTKQDVSEFNQRLALPPCDFANVELDMMPEELELYQQVFEESQGRIKELVALEANMGMHQMEFLEALLRVRQVMIWPQLYLTGVALKRKEQPTVWKHNSAKMMKLYSMMNEHPNEKTLIFCQFIEEMNVLEANFPGSFRIDGSLSKEDREAEIQGFKRAQGGAVFLIQIKAGGQGLNLQEATRVYITSPAWNPATELQAIARSHRTGQTQRVVVRKLIYNGTDEWPSVEQSICALQGHKSKVCSEVLNDPRLLTQIPGPRKAVGLSDILKIFRV